MRSPYRHFAGLFVIGVLTAGAVPAEGQLWRKFMPTGKSEATPQDDTVRTAGRSNAPAGRSGVVQTAATMPLQPAVGGDLSITQNNGPWMIVAASFSGEGAEKQATELAQELRGQYRIAAYVHEMSFKFGDENPGQGLDAYGAPTRRHYRRGDQAREIAVLVGDYPTIDDHEAQQMLAQIKSLDPKALNVDAGHTAQTMVQVRQYEDSIKEKTGKGKKRGPMGQAFFTRNPILPREYFVPKGVDPFVAKMNEGVEHSLLDCPGQKTIQVATFRGKTMLQTSKDAGSTSFWATKKHDDSNPLIEAAENAHLLTKELRAHGYEAYEFHDRTQSIVSIGSFDDVTQKLQDGRVVVVPAVQKIVQTFDAGFDTPADPLSGIGNDTMNQRLVEQQEQQVSMQLSGKQAQVVPGLNPKHVKIMHGRGKSVKVDRIIPMDVHPQAIDVPKRSISSAYSG
jgi:hypothetical protein